MEKKNSKIGILLLCVSFLLIGIGITFVVLSNNPKLIGKDSDNNKKVNKTTESSKEEILSVDDTLVNELFDSINNAHMECRYEYLYNTDKKITVSDFSDELVFKYGYKKLADEREKQGNNSLYSVGGSFTSDELRSAITSLFGKNYKYTDKSYENFCPPLKYDDTTKKYVIPREPACGGTCGPNYAKKIVKAIKKDNNIEIYVRVIYSSMDSTGKSIYYGDYNETKLLTNIDVDNEGYILDTNKNMIQGSLFKFIFTKEDNNYIYESSQLIKE